MRRFIAMARVFRGFSLFILAYFTAASADAGQQAPAQVSPILNAIAFSPDGKTLASSLRTGQISLWDAASGSRKRTLDDENGLPVNALAFSSGSGRLTSVGGDSVVHRWNVATGQQVQTLTGHQNPIRAVAVNPKNWQMTVSAGEDTRILRWNTAVGKLDGVLEGHLDFVNTLAFNADGKVLASGGQDRQIILWDVASGRQLLTLLGHETAVTSVAFARDGATLASGGDNGTVRLWDTASGRQLALLRSSGNKISSVAFSPTGSVVAAGGDDGVVFRWQRATAKPLAAFGGSGAPIAGVAFSPDGNTVVAGYRNGEIILFEAVSGQPRSAIRASAASAIPAVAAAGADTVIPDNTAAGAAAASATAAAASPDSPVIITARSAAAGQQTGPVDVATSLVFSPDGQTLASAAESGEIRLWNPQSGSEKRILTGHLGLAATGLAYGPNGATLTSVGRDSVLRQWNTVTGQQIQALTGHEAPLRAVAASADGKTVASAGEDTRIAVWNAATGKLAATLAGHTDFVNALAFSPDGQTIASGADDHTIILWDVVTGRLLRTLLGHDDGVTGLAFSRNGKTLVSASKDGTARLWEAATGRQGRVFGGARGRLKSIAISPDGSSVVAGGDGAELLRWDTATGTLRGLLRGPKQAVTDIVFSPDGSALASADETGQVTVFNAATGQARLVIQLPARAKGRGAAAVQARSATTAKSMQAARVGAAAMSAIPGAAILLITTSADPFSNYYAEILQAEGLNLFNTADVSAVTRADLDAYDVAILASMPLTPAQVGMFSDWVNAGGNLIAMRPDKQLAPLLGLSDAGETLAEGYLLVDTTQAPGNGIVNQTMQFHGTADRYMANGALTLATLYTTAATATVNPAVTLRGVGSGKGAAFTYDLARSVVYTRQGNPAWAAQERDGLSPIRSDDLYFGDAAGDSQVDWVDLNKVAIPQADEQQRLLANLVLTMNLSKKPLPRFWYLPGGRKAAIVMTGDDHGNGGTVGRFDQFKTQSPAGCSAAAWECIRGTSYIYPNTPVSNAQAAAYEADGFEIGLHINTNCGDFTPASLEATYVDQLAAFAGKYTSVPAPGTERHHCIVWSDWASAAKVQRNHGIRLDTSYYYWPPGWILNQPGVFSGSAMPMRFVDTDGSIIDAYGATTQMTDESGQSYPFTVDTLLDRALGTEGYFGTYVVNAHTDYNPSTVADAVIASATARGVAVISSRQLLSWLDGRNGASFSQLAWQNDSLSFSIVKQSAADGLQAMLPARAQNSVLISLSRDGSPVSYTGQAIKGIDYAMFPAEPGNYLATYGGDSVAPFVTATLPADGAVEVSVGTKVTATFSEAVDPSTINTGTFLLRNAAGTLVPASVTYDAAALTATLQPDAALAYGTGYAATVAGGAGGPAVKDLVGNAMIANRTWTFTTAAVPCTAQPCSVWAASAVPANPSVADPNAVELGMKFKSDVSGFITGIRFYKGSGNTGTHTGTLWSASGTKLRTATFSNETATGWQQVSFATPVAITANTVYVVSYHTNTGNYAGDNDFFLAAAVDNAPLHALKDGSSGGNGVYRYGASKFPNSTYRSSNYWVDVVFKKQ